MLDLTICVFVTIVAVLGHSGFEETPEYIEKLLEDADFFTAHQYASQGLPRARTTRQTAPVGFVCVPTGTCVNNSTNVIDPRIVTPGQTPIPVCPPGQVACYGGTAASAQCGQRYVPTVTTANGPSTLGAFPWQAYLLNQTGFTGSGVLIDQNYVLTAAHKVNLNSATPGNIRVYMGVHNPLVLDTAQMRTVVSITIHPMFDANTLRNDIAVLRLNTPISLGYQVNIGTACLPAAAASFVGQTCLVSGWGRTGFNINDAPTSPQKQVSVPIVTMDTCYTSMSAADVLGTNVATYLDRVGEICAGGQANLDACTQDGGSPLVCLDAVTGRYTIAGLVIWGKNCGRPNVYGVYVNVPNYRAWIDTTIAALNAGK